MIKMFSSNFWISSILMLYIFDKAQASDIANLSQFESTIFTDFNSTDSDLLGDILIDQDADKKMDPAITDVKIKAIIFERHAVQLKIDWTTVNIKNTTLEVNAKLIPTKYCKINGCFRYSIPLTERTIRLPENPDSIVEPKSCSIELGCSYEVRIATSSWKPSKIINYTVPECVDGICSCHHEGKLPNVTLAAIYNESHQTIDIKWTITPKFYLPPGIDVAELSIRVTAHNSTYSWGHLKILDHFAILLHNIQGKLLTSGIEQHNLTMLPKSGGKFTIFAHVQDTRNCTGKESVTTIEIPVALVETTNDSRQLVEYTSKWEYSIIIVLVSLGGCSMVFCILFYYRRKKKGERINNWRGIYHNVPLSNCTHVSMQENVLYIDKDILEARARGEADLLEIPHACLTIGHEIGKGAFGRVFIGRADNIGNKPGTQVVAIKQLKKKPSADELEEFLGEITTMKRVSKHPNVVSLLGCCTIRQPLLMVMEYVGCGDLLQYLRRVRSKHEARSTCVSAVAKIPICQSPSFTQMTTSSFQSSIMGHLKYPDLAAHYTSSSTSDASYITQPDSVPSGLRPSVTETMYTMLSHNPDMSTSSIGSLEYVLDHKELHMFAIQIARGMKHLEEKQITHRDLAARNILIDETKTLKISDFGLSRTGIYVNTRNKKVPLRWLSIEAVRDHLYSSKSDVWAFGIVLWEIGTLGGFPYPTVGNHELLAYLTSGQRLQRPDNCSEQLYQLMLQCWLEKPEDRPSFADLVKKLEPQQQKIYIDFNELGPDYVFPPTSDQIKTLQPSKVGQTPNGGA